MRGPAPPGGKQATPMAHKKGQGSSRNGRDSNAQRRGVKRFRRRDRSRRHHPRPPGRHQVSRRQGRRPRERLHPVRADRRRGEVRPRRPPRTRCRLSRVLPFRRRHGRGLSIHPREGIWVPRLACPTVPLDLTVCRLAPGRRPLATRRPHAVLRLIWGGLSGACTHRRQVSGGPLMLPPLSVLFAERRRRFSPAYIVGE